MSKVFIIAEAGVNHNGDIALAKKLIDEAKTAGVDAVKFQTFIAENLVAKDAKKADYQVNNTGNDDSQLAMLKKLELSFDAFRELKAYCDKIGIVFMSTPFDFESLAFLSEIEMPYWKIPSGEITNLPYLIRIAQTKKPVIMSTGMATIVEIRNAVEVLKQYGTTDLSLLHCTTEYPTPYEDINLKAMDTLKKEFCCKVGYSDHSVGITVPIAAVARGAQIIEKHFTLDKTMEGPDHRASLNPQELLQMTQAIRNTEKAIGSSEKSPAQSEKKNIQVARKSIVANKEIKKGELFTEENITVKRPGNGISPMEWFTVLGKSAAKDFVKDELIEL